MQYGDRLTVYSDNFEFVESSSFDSPRKENNNISKISIHKTLYSYRVYHKDPAHSGLEL